MIQPQEFYEPLLQWYETNKRVLPFRTHSTPYRVWVSEIMLQQTRVSAVLPYYERFMQELPTVQALADCEPERLMKLWQGLGYYSRARNLQKAAQKIMQEYNGQLPASYEELCKLPGIGPYTAGAIASISFSIPVPAVDGNVFRVFSRVLCDETDITKPQAKKHFTEIAKAYQPKDRPGDYNQALMELGALVCLPNGLPECEHCPLSCICQANQQKRQLEFPHKTEKAKRKIENYTAILVIRQQDITQEKQILLQQRPEQGLLAQMWQPILLEGTCNQSQAAERLLQFGIKASKMVPLAKARHIFTHLEWHMTGFLCEQVECDKEVSGIWAARTDLLEQYPLPNAFQRYWEIAKKVL